MAPTAGPAAGTRQPHVKMSLGFDPGGDAANERTGLLQVRGHWLCRSGSCLIDSCGERQLVLDGCQPAQGALSSAAVVGVLVGIPAPAEVRSTA